MDRVDLYDHDNNRDSGDGWEITPTGKIILVIEGGVGGEYSPDELDDLGDRLRALAQKARQVS